MLDLIVGQCSVVYTYLDEVTIQDERALNILFVYTAILDPNLDLGVEIYKNRDTS